MIDPKTCEHSNFECEARVNRLTTEGKVLLCVMADIQIKCADCGTPFHWVGVPQGVSYARPMASMDSLELRAPLGIGPTIPHPVQTFEVHPEELKHYPEIYDKIIEDLRKREDENESQ